MYFISMINAATQFIYMKRRNNSSHTDISLSYILRVILRDQRNVSTLSSNTFNPQSIELTTCFNDSSYSVSPLWARLNATHSLAFVSNLGMI